MIRETQIVGANANHRFGNVTRFEKPINNVKLGGVSYDANKLEQKESDIEGKQYCLQTKNGESIYFNDQGDDNNCINLTGDNISISGMDDFEFHTDAKDTTVFLKDCTNSFIDLEGDENVKRSNHILSTGQDVAIIQGGHGNKVKLNSHDILQIRDNHKLIHVKGEGVANQDSYLDTNS